ncbi:MAG: TonB-dependent receptor [Flavobacteriales bacterium]|nr:TonB-dependent receptor [Flavobacteriales bacterium]
MNKFIHIIFLTFIWNLTFSQSSLKGGLIDASTGESLPGATIYSSTSNKGTISDFNGNFSLDGLKAGEASIKISFIGYATKDTILSISDGENDLGILRLNPSSLGLNEVEVIASIANDRNTPVAASTLSGKFIEDNIGNQEYPEILRNTPSVYVTKTGGGFGDSRINVRGFDQRNTAVMINGIPVNDMENGWVYWSNWAGLADVTSKLQVQRGLGASKLAIPAVGGSINIVTNAADFKKGGSVSTTTGNDGYTKYAVMLASGKMENGLATTFQFTNTKGDGYIDGTKFEAYSFFSSTNYEINDKQSLSGTIISAPQWHHQRTSYGRFDNLFLSDFADNAPSGRGIKFNRLNGTLNGEEFSFRRNFFHKPKAFLNHYWDISDKTSLKTSAYISLGFGGGTGPRGRVQNANGRVYDSFSGYGVGIHDERGNIRYDDIVAYNQGRTNSINGALDANPSSTTSSGDGFIRRASSNYHYWYGVLSTLDHKLSENLTLTAGLDARYYKCDHFRRLENLMGNTSYIARSDNNDPNKVLTQTFPATFGNFYDRSHLTNQTLAYHNLGIVNWMGLFAQLEYSNDNLSAFATFNGSQQGFQRVDYFNYLDSDPEQTSEWQNFLGGNAKAGFNYNLNQKSRAFVNAGYYSKQPIFDNVFVNYRNDLNEDVQNQTITAFEAGYGYFDGKIDLDINMYYSQWANRQDDQTQQNDQGQDIQYIFENISQTHTGIEFEFGALLSKFISLNGMLSIGNWIYSDNFTATGTNIDTQESEGELSIYAKDLKVGDAAQTTSSIGLEVRPIKNLRITGNLYYADNLFAQYDVNNSAFFTEGGEVVKLPSYTLVNTGIFYTFDKQNVDLRLNINNLLDTKYISEMWTNNSDDPSTPEDEFLTTNQGWYGFGRTWNFTLKFRF